MRLETSVCLTLMLLPIFVSLIFLVVEDSSQAAYVAKITRAIGSQVILFFGFVWALSQIRPKLTMLGTLWIILSLALIALGSIHGESASEMQSRLIVFLTYPVLLVPFIVLAVRVVRSSSHERELIALNKGGTFGLAAAFQAVTGVPRSCTYLPSRVRRIIAYGLFVASQVSMGTALVILFGKGAWLLLLLMLAPAIGLRYLARRFCLTSLELMVRSDPRPSILFLRSFSDDQVRLEPSRRNLLSYFALIGEPSPTLDHILLEEGTEKGPVVAIGAPGSRPPFGAARAYVSDDDWKQVVSELAQTSQTVAIALDATAGIEWEMAELHLNEHTSKVLHLLPPRFAIASEARELVKKVRTSLPQIANRLAEIQAFLEISNRVCLGWYFARGGQSVVYTTTYASDASYRLALRDFFQTKEKELSSGAIAKLKPFTAWQLGFASFVMAALALSAEKSYSFFLIIALALGLPYTSSYPLVVAWTLICVSLFFPAISIAMGLVGLFDRSSDKVFAILGIMVGAAIIVLSGSYLDVPKIIHLLFR